MFNIPHSGTLRAYVFSLLEAFRPSDPDSRFTVLNTRICCSQADIKGGRTLLVHLSRADAPAGPGYLSATVPHSQHGAKMASAAARTCAGPWSRLFLCLSSGLAARPRASASAPAPCPGSARLTAGSQAPDAPGTQTLNSPPFSRRQPVIKTAHFSMGTRPLLRYAAPHRTRLLLAEACHVAWISQSPQNAFSIEDDAFF